MNYTRTNDAATTTLRIAGELDALSVPRLGPVVDQLAAEGRDVVVDLTQLRVIDATGVAALVTLFKRVRAVGGRVRFLGIAAQPRLVFNLLRLDVAFGMAE